MKENLFYLICLKYLPIIATSTPSERLFSDTGNHISIHHTCLDPNLLRRMIFLKRNMNVLDIFPPPEI